MAKEEDEGQNAILALAGSVCRRQFVGVAVSLLDVKSLVEHNSSLESVPFRDNFGFL